MQNTINYYYNLYPNEVLSKENELSFVIDYEYYYFILFSGNKNEILNIIKKIELLKNYNYHSHSIIININNEYITPFDNKNYILFKTNEYEHKTISLKEMLLLNSRITFNKEQTNNWGNLWSNKVDYLEYQVKEIGYIKKVITNSFSYYLGLSENAISYYNDTINNVKNDGKITICHKRINLPCVAKDYYNPINFVIDYEVRDIAEYIKTSFFNNSFNYQDIDSFFNMRIITEYEIRMLFSRLLYPSYYFDVYEKVIDGTLSEDELLKIIDRVDEYEDFLLEMFNYLNKKNPIPAIDWIINLR